MIPGKREVSPEDCEFRFVRSSGPGGQNVNKVATAVQLRFRLSGKTGLSEQTKQRIREREKARLNSQGFLIIDARRFRTQERNRKDALDRLEAIIKRASARPKPRVKTRPTLQSRLARLELKRRQGQKKAARRQANLDE